MAYEITFDITDNRKLGFGKHQILITCLPKYQAFLLPLFDRSFSEFAELHAQKITFINLF